MPRLNLNRNTSKPSGSFRATPSVFASAVDTYMATIDPSAHSRSPTHRGDKRRQKQTLSASAAEGTAAAEEAAGASGNLCRNPFCGAKLESQAEKYCAQKSYCQLYRGMLLHCATFATEEEHAVDLAQEELREAKKKKKKLKKQASGEKDAAAAVSANAEFSIPKRRVPITPTGAAAMENSEPVREDKLSKQAKKKLKRRLAEAEAAGDASSADGGSVESSNAEKQSSKKRRVVLDSSAADNTAQNNSTGVAQSKTPSYPPVPPPSTKVAGIEVIPLGAGRHPSSFGGSRYVRSGNRTTADTLKSMNPLARPPSLPRVPVSAADPPADPRLQRAPPTDPRRSESPRSFSSSLPDPARPVAASVPASAVSSGVMRNSDGGSNQPETRFAVTPSSSPVRAQDPEAPVAAANRSGPPSSKRISASEYLSNRKPQDPRVRPPSSADPPPPLRQESMQLHRSLSDMSGVQQPSSLPAGPERERTLVRSISEPPDSAVFRGGSRDDEFERDEFGSRFSDSTRRDPNDHRMDSSSTATRKHPEAGYARSSSYDDRREYDARHDLYRSDRPPSRPYSPNRYHDHSYEPDYRRPSSSYPQDPPDWQRRSDDAPGSSYRSSSRDPGTTSRVKTEQIEARPSERRGNVHPEIEPARFSKHDRFMKNVLSRFASFFPHALSPVLNKTTKPRKMRFYLDYVQRVERLSGTHLKVQVAEGKGIVQMKGREWLLLENPSTVELYKLILETLLNQGIAWRKLIDDSNRVYANAVQRLGNRAERSESFMRMWQGMKHNSGTEFPVERQASYFRGGKRHHWSFSVGNVEIGSGSHEEKKEAYRLAADDAMRFLLSLDILNDSQKYSDRRSEQPARDRESVQPQRERGGARSQQPTATTNDRPVQPTTVPAAVEIVDAPEVTVQRVRDDSFSSISDATFSPVHPSHHSVTEDDMDISEEDASLPAKADKQASAKPDGCAFCDMVRIRDPDAKFCIRCKGKQQQASGIMQDLLKNGLSTPR